MRAMVLAAGLGLRMRPLTLLRAKPALPVSNRPLLHWTLRELSRAGVREVVVNLHHLPDSVVDALAETRGLGLEVRCSRERRLLGTGGGPRAVRDFFGREPFLLVNGDVRFELDLRALVTRHRESGACATLALRPNRDPSAYSPVVSDRRGRILSIAGDPAGAAGRVSLFTGIHVLEPALLDRLPEGASDSVRDLYLPLLREGAHLLGVPAAGKWQDLGCPALYRDAQLRALPARRSLVARGAHVSARARLVRSVVGKGARVLVAAGVSHSVLWPGARVDSGARVEGAIVTTGGVVREGERAADVVVLPAAALGGTRTAGGRWERHGDMAWVAIS